MKLANVVVWVFLLGVFFLLFLFNLPFLLQLSESISVLFSGLPFVFWIEATIYNKEEGVQPL